MKLISLLRNPEGSPPGLAFGFETSSRKFETCGQVSVLKNEKWNLVPMFQTPDWGLYSHLGARPIASQAALSRPKKVY